VGRTYYIHPQGSDDDSGLSPGAAWRTLARISLARFEPGGRVLLVSGGTWNEPLILHGSGQPDNPITLSHYGAGPRPIITCSEGNVILLHNEGGWRIEGLEVFCSSLEPLVPPSVIDPETGLELKRAPVYSGQVETNRGIHVLYDEPGPWSSILIRDNHVHGLGVDTMTEGIVFLAVSTPDQDEPVAEQIRIENNIVENLGWRGIGTAEKQKISARTYKDSVFRNVTITGNTVRYLGVQGIVLGNANHSSMERNVVQNAGMYQGEGVSWGPAGLWPFSCSDVVIRFNEVWGMHDSNSGNDATGIDIDWHSKRIVVAYNYTHHNQGNGIVTMACHDSQIYRNKISANAGLINIGPGQIGLSDYHSDTNAEPITGVKGLEISENLIVVDRPGTTALNSIHISAGDSWTGNSFCRNRIVFPDPAMQTSFYAIGHGTDVNLINENQFFGVRREDLRAVYHGRENLDAGQWQDLGYDGDSTFEPVCWRSLPVPESLCARIEPTEHHVALVWTVGEQPATKIHHFNVFRTPDPGTVAQYRHMLGETSECQFTDLIDFGNTSCTYQVQAEDACGHVSPVSQVSISLIR